MTPIQREQSAKNIIVSNPMTVGLHDGKIAINLKDVDEALLKKVLTSVCSKLRKLGWLIAVPYTRKYDPQHGKAFNKSWAERFRVGSKNGLEFEGWICGRSLGLEFWENINDHTKENSNGGRYIFNREAVMPQLALMRLRACKSIISKHLEKHFGATLGESCSLIIPKPKLVMDLINADNKKCWHYKPELGRRDWNSDSNRKSGEGQLLEEGMRVYCRDYSGRWVTGVTRYNINNMWWVVTGRYDRLNVASWSIYQVAPADPRETGSKKRRLKLENLMAKSVKNLDFTKAQIFKDLLFGNQALFHIKKGDYFYRPGACGYTNNQIEAGKYTKEEIQHHQDSSLTIIEVAA
jgi:hypothetical protein